jgi:ligand-binding sensor domain-containing protein
MRCAVLPLLLLVATVSGLASVGGVPDYAKRLWQAQDGLPDEIVHAFAQTPDGYLWIGTQGGLLRFNGERFVLYDRGNTPGLTESGVNCLLAALTLNEVVVMAGPPSVAPGPSYAPIFGAAVAETGFP